MLTSLDDLPLVCEGHAEHGPEWTLVSAGPSSVPTCIACAVDVCAEPGGAKVRKRFVLAAFVSLLKEKGIQVAELLRANPKAAAHVLAVLMELIWIQDSQLANLSTEGIGLLITIVDDQEFALSVVNTISDWNSCNYLESLSAFLLVGKMCSQLPWLGSYLLKDYGRVIQVICSGTTFPNEEVRATTLFVLVQVFKEVQLAQLPAELGLTLARDLVKTLKSEQSKKVLANALALLRLVLQEPLLAPTALLIGGEAGHLPTALKKVLLARDAEGLHVAAVQCVGRALGLRDTAFADALLDNDVAEILGEILSTNNDVLTESIFCALLNFTLFDNFFRKCHAVYGMDSILRASERLFACHRPQTARLAFPLLQQIFSRQPAGISLFSSNRAARQAISVLLQGINSAHRKISLEATTATASFLRKDFLPLPIPFEDMVAVVSSCAKYLTEIFPSSSRKAIRRLSRGYSQAKALVGQAEELLDARLAVMHQLCKLIQDFSKDPVASQDSFVSNDATTETACTLDGLIAITLKTMDEVFIPVVMANMDVVSKSSVYVHLLSSLTLLYEVVPSLMAKFFARLAAGGALLWIWEVKKTGCQDLDDQSLKSSVNLLLETILTSLTTEAVVQPSTSAKLYDFQLLDGDMEECIVILGESSDYLFAESEAVQRAQSTLLAFLYHVRYLSNSISIPSQRLLEMLTVFVQNNAELHKLPIHTQKHLLFLFSIQQWLRHAAEEEWNAPALRERDTNVLLEVICHNQLCVKAILEIFMEGSGETLCQLLPVVEVCCSRLAWEDRWVMVDALSDTFCTFIQIVKENGTSTWESNYTAILKTICQLQCSVPETPVAEAINLKVLYNVCSTIGTLTEDESELWSLSYLYALLSQSTTSHDTRVLGVMLSNGAIMDKLAQRISSPMPQPISLNVLASLVYYQAKHKIQVAKSVVLDLAAVMRLMTSAWLELATAAVHLLSTVLQVEFDSQLLQVQYQKTDFSSLLSSGVHSPPTSPVFRSIYFVLQTAAAKDDCSLQDAAFDGMAAFLTFLRRFDCNTVNHFMKQPWIGTVFIIHLERLLSGKWTEGLRLLNLFLDSKVKNDALSKFVNIISSTILEKMSASVSQSEVQKSNIALLKRFQHDGVTRIQAGEGSCCQAEMGTTTKRYVSKLEKSLCRFESRLRHLSEAVSKSVYYNQSLPISIRQQIDKLKQVTVCVAES